MLPAAVRRKAFASAPGPAHEGEALSHITCKAGPITAIAPPFAQSEGRAYLNTLRKCLDFFSSEGDRSQGVDVRVIVNQLCPG